MKVVYFTHSLRSCWNHGNAHFLRGILSDLARRGHDVLPLEPQGSWSLSHLLADHGEPGLRPFQTLYPELSPRSYAADDDIEELLEGADLVIVHEWNDTALVAAVGRLRMMGAPFLLLFHDTHHRAVSDPDAMRTFELVGYDGILAFGEALSEIYERWGWGGRVFVWHEAADIRRFRPPDDDGPRHGTVWIGNWGDDERTRELHEFVIEPAGEIGMALDVYGVRFPEQAQTALAARGIAYRGWAPNAVVPAIFARHLATLHVPRRFYAALLPGIPTIRVFEALACGIPLVCAPWEDSEQLFRPGLDYLVARTGDEAARHLRDLGNDPDLRAALSAHGLATVHARHSCAHRVDELLSIVDRLRAPDLRLSA